MAILMAVLLCTSAQLAYPAENPPSGKQIEMRWSELGPFIAGGRITTVLPDGTVLKGRALAVNEDALVLDVSTSSDKKTYPKGRTSIPRDQVTTLSLREMRGAVGRIALTIGGIFAGGGLGGRLAAGDESGSGAVAALVVGALVAGGVGGYYAGRSIDRKTTVIKVLPD